MAMMNLTPAETMSRRTAKIPKGIGGRMRGGAACRKDLVSAGAWDRASDAEHSRTRA
jgi:hypothetical protein